MAPKLVTYLKAVKHLCSVYFSITRNDYFKPLLFSDLISPHFSFLLLNKSICILTRRKKKKEKTNPLGRLQFLTKKLTNMCFQNQSSFSHPDTK